MTLLARGCGASLLHTQYQPVDALADITEVNPVAAVKFSRGANPILRVAVEQNLTDIEARLDPGTSELIDMVRHYDRAQQKFIWDLLECDDNLRLLHRHRQHQVNIPHFPGHTLVWNPLCPHGLKSDFFRQLESVEVVQGSGRHACEWCFLDFATGPRRGRETGVDMHFSCCASSL
jgi:hypothetical protein